MATKSVNPLNTPSANLQSGSTYGLWIDHTGQRWSHSPHPSDEWLVVLAGEVELEMEGKHFHPKIGEEIFIPAQVAHTIRNLGRKSGRWLFSPRPLKEESAPQNT